MTSIEAVRAVHIAAGTVALGAFAIPMLTSKGSRVHRRAGWVFVISIGVVAASALAAAAHRLSHPSSEEVRRVSVFLGYLSLLAANSSRTGIRALRTKGRTGRHDGAIDVLFPALLLAGALTLGIWGQLIGFPLAVVFGVVGVVVSVRQLRYWLTVPSSPQHGKYQHMQSMVGASIAALTAFLVVNVRAFGVPERLQLVAWLAPTLIGLPGVLVWVAALRKKEDPRPT